MPIHDWTRVPPGLFHDFHQTWTVAIKNALNRGLLPKGLSALVEQKTGPKEGDVLAIETRPAIARGELPIGGAATLERPTARIERRVDRQHYARRANRIVVRHHLGEIVAVIEIVSPGNKDSAKALSEFTNKIVSLLDAGIHILVVDLFPPTREACDRIAASYEAGNSDGTWRALVEPLRLSDPIPDMPLFLIDGLHVKVPLEATYNLTWEDTPNAVREAVMTGNLPNIG